MADSIKIKKDYTSNNIVINEWFHWKVCCGLIMNMWWFDEWELNPCEFLLDIICLVSV